MNIKEHHSVSTSYIYDHAYNPKLAITNNVPKPNNAEAMEPITTSTTNEDFALI